jgi:hypothetical protein
LSIDEFFSFLFFFSSWRSAKSGAACGQSPLPCLLNGVALLIPVHSWSDAVKRGSTRNFSGFG